MALFFDLSIPYLENDSGCSSSLNKARKDARLRAVVRAMELGYTGVAYDRPFRGILSEAERCKIAPFPLSSLLKVAPALANSAAFHRDLLGVPRSSPFRQYTRLTISVQNAAAVTSLNGNALLRTYDLVALRPLTQEAFDKACESSEVDIIAMDLSQKIPFRLKLPSIKLAIQRGLNFEITYSHLITDVHVRRQILSDVKLLSVWTRGKNVIFSSAASTLDEIRGPNDVVNLAVSLLDLSSERAKYAISRNCRSLVANALRKKNFYKETIRIERIIPDEQCNSKKCWFDECSKWDPLSSEKGDLPSLDDITNLFSSTCEKSSRSDSINFTSLLSEPPFLLSESIAAISSPNKLTSPATSNQVPSSAAAPAGSPHQVATADDSLSNKMTNISTILDQQKPSCQEVLESAVDMANFLVNSKAPCQSVEVNECLKLSDEPATISCTESELSRMFLEVKKSSKQYGETNDDYVPTKAEPTPMVAIENKPNDIFVDVGKSLHNYDNHGTETTNDAAKLMDICPTPKASNYERNGDEFITCNVDPSFVSVKKNKPLVVLLAIQKCLNQSDNEFNETSNDAAEIPDCMPDIVGNQITAGQLPCYTNFMDKRMLKELPKTFKEDLIDEVSNGLCIPLQDNLIKSTSHDQGVVSVSCGKDIPLKDAFKKAIGQEAHPSEFDAPLQKSRVLAVEEIQKSEIQSGRRKRKERLHYPAYHFPFKGLLKPMFFKKNLFNSKRMRKDLELRATKSWQEAMLTHGIHARFGNYQSFLPDANLVGSLFFMEKLVGPYEPSQMQVEYLLMC